LYELLGAALQRIAASFSAGAKELAPQGNGTCSLTNPVLEHSERFV